MILGVILLSSSCIKNDIPYPVIELEIQNVKGDGFTLKSIDTKNYVATIELDETTDIRNVVISSVEYTAGAKLTSSVVGTFDMRTPISTTLYLYQYYNWTIEAEQTISREFKVAGQIGEERIDVTQCTVEVDVNEETTDLSDVTITSMKLGPDDITTYSPALEDLTNTSFETVRRVVVTAHDRSETWSIYVNLVEAAVSLTTDAWGTIAWLNASGDTTDPDQCYFAYRKSGDSNWVNVAATSVSNGVFSTKVTGLSPSTDYKFIAYAGGNESTEVTETTESTPALTGGGFDNWQQIGNPWYAYGEGEQEYWGTGNKGAALLNPNSNVTLPSTDTAPGSTGEYSAALSSSTVMGVFAAGNIFTGYFIKASGVNGIIAFGRPYTQRPLALKGWAKYTQGVVTHSKLDDVAVGDNDRGIIYIALGTWDAETYGYDSTGELFGDSTTPIVVDTRDKNTFFDSTSSDIIAYGELIFDGTQDWDDFEIELTYRDLVNSSGTIIENSYSRVPTHIVIVCTSSIYGDYFTGSTSSKLLIDDFELVYE